MPRLGALEREAKSLAPIYLKVIEAVTGVAWPAYVLLAIWGQPLVRILYGPAWENAGALIPFLALAHGLTLAVAPHYDMLIVKRRARLLFACETGLFGLTFAALAFAARFDLMGVALALAIGAGLFVICYLEVLRRIVGFRLRDLVTVWGRSATIAMAVAPVAGVARALCPEGALATLVGCSISGLAAIAAATLAMRISRHELDQHVVTLGVRLPGFHFLFARQGVSP